jgi:hypothetical protein
LERRKGDFASSGYESIYNRTRMGKVFGTLVNHHSFTCGKSVSPQFRITTHKQQSRIRNRKSAGGVLCYCIRIILIQNKCNLRWQEKPGGDCLMKMLRQRFIPGYNRVCLTPIGQKQTVDKKGVITN